MPWENPSTGARGTVTPLATAYNQDGATCRDFLASYVKDGSESWLQGEACRAARGKWEVRKMRPWKSTWTASECHAQSARSPLRCRRTLEPAFRVAVGRRAPHIGSHEGGALPA